jgi:hypothetical protein
MTQKLRGLIPLFFSALALLTSCNGTHSSRKIFLKEGEPLEGSHLSRVIYGPDSRLDLFQVIDQRTRRQARSVAALIANKDLQEWDSHHFELKSSSLGEAYGLCSSEAFLDQKNPAFCTGFLVAPHVLVTAGHCILNDSECAETSFIFGFSIEEPGTPYWIRPKTDAYRCKRLLHTESGESETDFAVIELDRPAPPDRQPLPLRRKGKIQSLDLVSMLGHALGLPLKQTMGRVIETSKYHFSTSLDSFGGNSGAPVFNTLDGTVEGVFRGGDEDFEQKEGCFTSKKCTEKTCQGEVVTSISEIFPYLR